MNPPPAIIDGAQVIEYAWSDTSFGTVYDTDGNVAHVIHGLAICRYKDSNIIYRFSCDGNWETSQDADYTSIQEAKDQLPMQYRVAPIVWRRHNAAQQADTPEPLTRPGDP